MSFNNVQMSPSQRLDKAVIAIMGKDRYQALAGILMIGTREAVDDIPSFPKHLRQTACTNGRDEWYNNEFINGLTDAELRGLVLHENYHKMYRHLISWYDLAMLDRECEMQATDYVINIKLYDENKADGFAVLPKGGLLEEKYRGWNVAETFNHLREAKQGKGKGKGEGEDEDEGEGRCKGGGDDEGEDEGEGEGKGPQSLDHHDYEGAKKLTEEEEKDLTKEIDEAIRQGVLMAGSSGTGGDRDLEELLEPQVDWRQVLRDFITATCAGQDYSTWRRPNRRYMAGGLYMPSGVSETVEEVCVSIDMSGSTWNMVSQFMGELKGVIEQVKPDLLRILYWDTVVCREEKYTMDELDGLLSVTKPKGGGGTTVQCVPDYCNEFGIKPQAHIVLTDGDIYGGWGTGWNAPVLWAICDNKRARPAHGKYVNIKSC